VAKQRQGYRPAQLGVRALGDAVGIQVPIGRIGADRNHWQTIFDAPAKPAIYRLYNGVPADSEDPGNSMIVEVNGAKRTIQVKAGTSVDVLGKKIRVKAGTGGDSLSVEGWYVYVS
jgi:hypothetical protein